MSFGRGGCVFYRPVCKVPNSTLKWLFSKLFTFIRQRNPILTKNIKSIAFFISLANLTFWSVIYQPNRWPTWNFVNHLHLLIPTIGQNFKFMRFLGKDLKGPSMLRIPKKQQLSKTQLYSFLHLWKCKKINFFHVHTSKPKFTYMLMTSLVFGKICVSVCL